MAPAQRTAHSAQVSLLRPPAVHHPAAGGAWCCCLLSTQRLRLRLGAGRKQLPVWGHQEAAWPWRWGRLCDSDAHNTYRTSLCRFLLRIDLWGQKGSVVRERESSSDGGETPHRWPGAAPRPGPRPIKRMQASLSYFSPSSEAQHDDTAPLQPLQSPIRYQMRRGRWVGGGQGSDVT